MRYVASLALAASLGASVSAEALTWQAALREKMITQYQHPFGTDNALRVRRDVQELGFDSFTLVTRMQMQSPTDSAVFAPPIRTRRRDLETMVSSLLSGKDDIVLKPIITQDAGLGVANRMTQIRPQNASVFFSTYNQTLEIYLSIALKREVTEFVVATGLHALWQPAYAQDWIDLVKESRRRVGVDTKLSIELSGEEDIAALENWATHSPSSFAAFAEGLGIIRVSAAPVELTQGLGTWNDAATAALLTQRLDRVGRIFPQQQLSLANVTVPGCQMRTVSEDEVFCQPGAVFDKAYQNAGIHTFFRALRLLAPQQRARLHGIEFLMATTEREPDEWDFDPRFPYYNDTAKAAFFEEVKLSTEPRGPASVEMGSSTEKLSCIYYEQGDEKDLVGPLHARLMENLMGAFKNWRSERRNVARFESGALRNCDAVFYLATNYNMVVRTDILAELSDYAHEHPLVWMNYKFDQFTKVHDERARTLSLSPLAFTASKIEQAMENPSPQNLDPGFYRYFDYKGETFEKLAKWDMIKNRFMASPELNLIEVKDSQKTEILATARHSRTGERQPYWIRSRDPRGGSIWYVADSPFSYVHYEDRYLILCDLMWDILGEEAPKGPLGALVRIEDVNPNQNSFNVRWAVDYLASEKIPFALAVIPYYANVFGSEFTEGRSVLIKPDYEFKDFAGSLKYAQAQGADFVWHGIYHQAGDLLSGYDGMSGPDYEFWLYPEDTPLPHDSSDFVIEQLEKGEKVFKKMGIRPTAWEVPHYAASALDNVLFGKLFEWNYHRSLYFWSDVEQDAPLGPQHRMFDCDSESCRAERRALARQTKINVHSLSFAGQPTPYRVWKDSYGQALIPETLGMIDYVFYNDKTWRPVSNVDDILRRAKKLKVIRGSLASFFWHPDVASRDLPYYMRHPGHYETEGGKNTLIRIVKGLKEMGYEFKSINDCKLFPSSTCKL